MVRQASSELGRQLQSLPDHFDPRTLIELSVEAEKEDDLGEEWTPVAVPTDELIDATRKTYGSFMEAAMRDLARCYQGELALCLQASWSRCSGRGGAGDAQDRVAKADTECAQDLLHLGVGLTGLHDQCLLLPGVLGCSQPAEGIKGALDR